MNENVGFGLKKEVKNKQNGVEGGKRGIKNIKEFIKIKKRVQHKMLYNITE